jgi:uncharacterized oligopeptide transporter (OPT) family protein
VGNANVGVAVIVGDKATVGVRVFDDITVKVGVGVFVSVSVAVMAGAVGVIGSFVEDAQAETKRKISKMIPYTFI